MPSSTLDDLLEAYSRVSTENRVVLERFMLIAGQFQQQGIAFLVLKGADVISRLYGVRGSRPLSDVDLLVHDRDLPAIDQLLTGLGFVQQIDGNPSYASADLGLSLDLVTTLWYLDERGLADVWSRAITRPFPPIAISCLATDDLLIHLTAYAVVHRGQVSAAYTQDMKLLVEKESPNWPAITTQAKRYGLTVPMHYGLNHIRTIFPSVRIPDAVLSSLAPSNRRERVLTWLLRKLVTNKPLPELGHLLLFLTHRPGKKLAWLGHTLCPSQAFLSYRYGQAGYAKPWRTRLLRIYGLTVAALTLSGRVFRRLATRPSRPIPRPLP
jgi:hypothetical protein